MKTLKETIYDILLTQPETRNSDKKLIWEVWSESHLIEELSFYEGKTVCISYAGFMKAPAFESIRRCRQALQRSDLLTGKKLIQPTKEIKEKRVKLAKSKGFEYQEGKAVYNPLTNCYEI